MYKYSPIKKIRIKNFRNIGDFEIKFGESPIIALVGENESGKTSTIKAFAVAALHAWQRDQKDYIRDGTYGFGVEIELGDGTKVTRIKNTDYGKYIVENADGVVWETNKIDNQALPPKVFDVMGMIEEPETKEYLQVRTYENQLLFVVTPTSTNYKVMYDALKVEQLVRAIKLGSEEVNELKSSVNENNIKIETYNDNIRRIRIIDLEPLTNIKNRLKEQKDIVIKLGEGVERVKGVGVKEKELGALSLVKDGKYVDMLEASNIFNIQRIISRLVQLRKREKSLTGIAGVKEIKTDDIKMLESAISKIEKNKLFIKESETYKEVKRLSNIQEHEFIILNKIRALVNGSKRKIEIKTKINVSECEVIGLKEVESMHKALRLITNNTEREVELKKVRALINEVNESLKEVGYIDIECGKCGEITSVMIR